MDVRQLEFFLAVAEEGNFTRAAKRSYVSQPGLSSSIRALERELRVRLFDRVPAGASLTPAGTVFLTRARRMLADAHAAQAELAQVPGNGTSRSVRIGAEQCLGNLVDLADLLSIFAERNPGTELAFEQAPTNRLLEGIHTNVIDVALVAQSPPDDNADTLRAGAGVVLRREPFVFLTSNNHPLGRENEVSWEVLASERFVDLASSWAAREVLDEAFATRPGCNRISAVSVGDVHMLLDLVGRGFGIAAVPESVAEKSEAAGLCRLKVAGPPFEWEVLLRVAERANAAARAFAAMLLPQTAISNSRDALTERA
ncbi:LysR family transcriptional regulator [Micromonospora sp. B9E7]|uniref:LysR family transcriptional regulator n=1 Tax=Micromonospora sp. B9E7 TaxID=3153574 RepID=UPI00325EA5CF